MKKYLNISEILDLNISTFPKKRQSIEYKAKKEDWNWRYDPEHKGRGRPKKEYELPLKYQINAKNTSSLTESKNYDVKVVVTDDMAVTQLAKWQRDTAIARVAVVREVLKMTALMSKSKAIRKFASLSAENKLDDVMMSTLRQAKAKGGSVSATAKIGKSTLYEWVNAYESAELAKSSAVLALAPKARATKLPEWAGAFMQLWKDPAKPSLAEVMRELAEVLKDTDMTVPSYHQALYFLDTHVGNVEAERGRMGSREIKTIKPFNRRDTSPLFPTDVYTADGHTFDAEVAHPITGRAFRPEVTVIIDVNTRLVVGFSIDLAESGLAVLDAIRVSVCNYGIPAIFYVDNGSGYKNSMMTADGTGLMNRLGTSVEHSIAYNSQSHGLVERLHQSLWIRLAKKLPTYMGADMDRQKKQEVYKKTRKDLAEFGKSQLLVEWNEFMTLCTEAVKKYNNLSHSGLPRRYNKLTGRKEHLSPQVMWDEQTKAMENSGIKRVLVTDGEQVDLFRPYVKRKCLRGEISLFNNRYFSRELEEYHGDEVYVGYDIHDASRVWVRDKEHRLLAVAEFEANKSAYFAESVVEQARQKRAKGQLKRNDVKRDEILESMSPRHVLEHVEQQRLPESDIEKAQDAWASFIEAEQVEDAELIPSSNFAITPPNPPLERGGIERANRIATEETQDSRFERWLDLNAQVKAGAELGDADVDFYELYQESKIFKIKMKQYETGIHEVKVG